MGDNDLTQNKKSGHQPTLDVVEDAIRQARGNVAKAADALGVHRTSLHHRIAKSTRLQQVVSEERERRVDVAEDALMAEVEARNIAAIIWTLKASPEAKRRGWGERQEIANAQDETGKPIPFRTVDYRAGLSETAE